MHKKCSIRPLLRPEPSSPRTRTAAGLQEAEMVEVAAGNAPLLWLVNPSRANRYRRQGLINQPLKYRKNLKWKGKGEWEVFRSREIPDGILGVFAPPHFGFFRIPLACDLALRKSFAKLSHILIPLVGIPGHALEDDRFKIFGDVWANCRWQGSVLPGARS